MLQLLLKFQFIYIATDENENLSCNGMIPDFYSSFTFGWSKSIKYKNQIIKMPAI